VAFPPPPPRAAGPGWLHEIDQNGYRMLVRIEGGRLALTIGTKGECARTSLTGSPAHEGFLGRHRACRCLSHISPILLRERNLADRH
jgi:hypothetical protein